MVAATVKLVFLGCRQKHYAAYERNGSGDGGERDIVFLFASGVNWSDVHDFFCSRVRKASPRKTEQTRDDQNDSKYFVHNGLLWEPSSLLK